MKKTTVLSMALAAALAAAVIPASAAEMDATAEKPANYVLLKAGIYSPSINFDLDNFNGGNRSRLDSKTGFAGEVAMGHYFMPMFALELGAGYFESDGSPAAQPGKSKVRVVPLIATGKLLFPIGMFEPYGLAGIGAYISDLDVSGTSGNFRGSTEITYGIHAGAGFNINFHRHIFAGLEGKYLWAEPSFGGQHLPLDGFVTTATLGFRF